MVLLLLLLLLLHSERWLTVSDVPVAACPPVRPVTAVHSVVAATTKALAPAGPLRVLTIGLVLLCIPPGGLFGSGGAVAGTVALCAGFCE